MMTKLFCGFVLFCGIGLAAQRGEEMLWANGAPGSEGETAPEVFQPSENPKLPKRFTVVHYPSIYVFLPPKEGQRSGGGDRAGAAAIRNS